MGIVCGSRCIVPLRKVSYYIGRGRIGITRVQTFVEKYSASSTVSEGLGVVNKDLRNGNHIRCLVLYLCEVVVCLAMAYGFVYTGKSWLIQWLIYECTDFTLHCVYTLYQ